MSATKLPSDPLWPRAAHWLVPASEAQGARCDIGLLGVGAWSTSITPTGAHATPGAVREALLRYSTYSTSHRIDVTTLAACDFGDVAEPDGEPGEERVCVAIGRASAARLLVAIGGDNSITYSMMRAFWPGEALAEVGLITVDAHHDMRDGISNGSPVRRLIEAGLPGRNVVQLGIADFANSAEYAERTRDAGIIVVGRDEFRRRPLETIVAQALEIAGAGGRPVYVDIDVDAADRSVVPGCPSSAPGGFSADEMRQMAFLFGADPRVRAIDLTEIDATIDAPDQRTIRLAALLVLEAACGLAMRDGR